MANRHLSRSVVLQTLFELDALDSALSAAREQGTRTLERNAKEFAPGATDLPFMRQLLLGILGKRSEIDAVIMKAAPEWPLDRIAAIDRNVLRLSLYELLFNEGEVPPKVAINEGIELAKSFGSDTSAKFVNGVLGAVYKDMGEPRKDETSKEETQQEVLEESLVGGIVFAEKDGKAFCALVHDVFGRWTFSKGHLREGERGTDAAVRVVQEEMGIPTEVVEPLGENIYTASDPAKGTVKKRVAYYLMKAPFTDLSLKASGGLDDAQWFSIEDFARLNLYPDIAPIATKALERIATLVQ